MSKNWDDDDEHRAWMWVMYVCRVHLALTPTPPGNKETIGNSSLLVVKFLLLLVVQSGASTLVQTCSVSFTGAKFSPNFDLKKKSDFDLHKGFFMEQKGPKKKPPQIRQIFKNFFLIKSPDFHDKFQ
jgi:hypothetical protein